jgi:hypothetical protein
VSDAPTVTIPLADYERLLELVELDDMLVTCEVCGAWLDRDDKGTASVQDFNGCWKAASGGQVDECRAYRAHVLEAARLGATGSR